MMSVLIAVPYLDAYGRISFANDHRAKYVRVDSDSSAKEMFELLTSVFNLPTPGN